MRTLLLVYVAIGLAGITLWITNLLWIINNFGALDALFLFKLVGLVPPFQFLTVWFT